MLPNSATFWISAFLVTALAAPCHLYFAVFAPHPDSANFWATQWDMHHLSNCSAPYVLGPARTSLRRFSSRLEHARWPTGVMQMIKLRGAARVDATSWCHPLMPPHDATNELMPPPDASPCCQLFGDSCQSYGYCGIILPKLYNVSWQCIFWCSSAVLAS